MKGGQQQQNKGAISVLIPLRGMYVVQVIRSWTPSSEEALIAEGQAVKGAYGQSSHNKGRK